jgi:CubicO group peptidase (beta-lactamase class C family)
MTQGYLVGEVLRRIIGASLGTVFRTEIAEPLGADFHIGRPASEGQDLVMDIPARFGLGFGLAGPTMPTPNPNTIFWGGYGGSLAIIDMDARTAFGYAHPASPGAPPRGPLRYAPSCALRCIEARFSGPAGVF